MKIKQFYKVDEVTGEIIETYALDINAPKFKLPLNYYEGWGSERSFFKPIYDFHINDWVEGQTNDELLRNEINNKLKELNQKCEETILGKFAITLNDEIYQFSNDVEAQMNFEKLDRAFEKGKITELYWTAYDMEGKVVRILLTSEMFSKVYLAHLNHIQDNISKFRDILQPQVENATTITEVQSIIW